MTVYYDGTAEGSPWGAYSLIRGDFSGADLTNASIFSKGFLGLISKDSTRCRKAHDDEGFALYDLMDEKNDRSLDSEDYKFNINDASMDITTRKATYTVSLNGFDSSFFAGTGGYNALFVDTAIPAALKNKVSFSNVNLFIDNALIHTWDNPVITPTSDGTNKYLQIQLLNTWNSEVEAQCAASSITTVPSSSIVITFDAKLEDKSSGSSDGGLIGPVTLPTLPPADGGITDPVTLPTLSPADGGIMDPVSIPTAAPADDSPEASTDIIARLGFQTGLGYDFRDAADVASEDVNYKYNQWRIDNGLAALDYGKDAKGYYYIYRGGVVPKWSTYDDDWATGNKQYYDTETGKWTNIKDEATGRSKKFSTAELAVPATDVQIKDQVMNADGTYTVSISGLDLTTMPAGWDTQPYSNNGFNMLYVAVNAPRSNTQNKSAKAVATSFKIDGVEQLAAGETVEMPQKIDQEDVLQFMLASVYVKEGEQEPKYGKKATGEPVLSALPHDSIEITFEVSGVDWSSEGVSGIK